MKTILRSVSFVLLCLLLSCATPLNKKVKIALVGDSTVTDNAGWGKAFAAKFNENTTVLNFAKGGRSSKSFLAEKRLPPVLEAEPDYVFIQFGHNGQPGKGFERETDPQTTYKFYLRIFIYQFSKNGIKPILVSSVVRRKFDENGRIKSSLTPWAKAAKEVAEEMKIPFIDLHSISMSYHNKIGKEKSLEFNPKPDDVTHFNSAGADAISDLVIEEMKKAVPDLAGFLK